MKKEYLLALIGGLLLLAYVLEAVIDPLNVLLPTPYHFLNPVYLARYPFTTAIIFFRSLSLFLIPLFLFSWVDKNYLPKGIILLILAGLMQLYAIQEIATNAKIVPLEWALSLASAGAALLLPAVWYFIRGSLSSAHQKLKREAQTTTQDSPDWLKE